MNDYQRVAEALKEGAEPSMLCMTCPWDRYCITPPSMTSAEVKTKVGEARRTDAEKAQEARAKGQEPGLPAGALMTILALGGRDKQAEICPVMALKLRTADGRGVVDALKEHMQGIEQLGEKGNP